MKCHFEATINAINLDVGYFHHVVHCDDASSCIVVFECKAYGFGRCAHNGSRNAEVSLVSRNYGVVGEIELNTFVAIAKHIVVFASSCARYGCFAHGANEQVGVAKVCFAEGDVVFTFTTNEHETYASRNFLNSCKQHNACAWAEA